MFDKILIVRNVCDACEVISRRVLTCRQSEYLALRRDAAPAGLYLQHLDPSGSHTIMSLSAKAPGDSELDSCLILHSARNTSEAVTDIAPPLPTSLTPVSEEVYSDSDLQLNADSTSVAEADTEAVLDRSIETETVLDLSRKRSAKSLETGKEGVKSKPFLYLDFEELHFNSRHRMKPARSELEPSEEILMQSDVHGYQTGAFAKPSLDSIRPPNKRARPSINEFISINRSVYIDQMQAQPSSNAHQACAQRSASAGLNIAPRAHRRAKRRAVSKGPWANALKQILPALKSETVVSLLLTACERHHPTTETVRSHVVQEPACRRLVVRNVPYSLTACELFEALENAFGAVEKVAVCTKGFGAVVFEHFESAFHAAFGQAPPDPSNHFGHALIPAESLSSLSVKGRQLQFRYLPNSDSTWEILHGGPGVEVLNCENLRQPLQLVSKNDGNSSSAAQVGPRRHKGPGHGIRRRRTTELLVRDLSPAITEAALASAFAHFGDLRRIYIPTDAKGCSKCHGYVTFHRQEDALRAAQQTQRLIGDQLAFVSLAGADPNRSRRVSHKQTQGGPTNPMPLSQRRRGRNRTTNSRSTKAGSVHDDKLVTVGVEEDVVMFDEGIPTQQTSEHQD